MASQDIDRYAYSVDWDETDQVFVAHVVEFPALAAHGDTHEGALGELKFVVHEVLEDLVRDGEQVPAPVSLRDFSGRFNVRIPKELHRQLVVSAQRQGVSLNQFVLMKLAK